MTAWSRQCAFKSGGYISELPSIWGDVKVSRDSAPMVKDRQLGKADCFGNRLRPRGPQAAEAKARAALTRRTACDPEAARWWRGLTPAQANQVVADLAAGKVRLT